MLVVGAAPEDRSDMWAPAADEGPHAAEDLAVDHGVAPSATRALQYAASRASLPRKRTFTRLSSVISGEWLSTSAGTGHRGRIGPWCFRVRSARTSRLWRNSP